MTMAPAAGFWFSGCGPLNLRGEKRFHLGGRTEASLRVGRELQLGARLRF